MISAYLMYKRMFSAAEQAIEFFHSKRMLPGVRTVCAECLIFYSTFMWLIIIIIIN